MPQVQPGAGLRVPTEPAPSSSGSRVAPVGAADFVQKVLRAPGPVVVEFMNPSCPHCRRMEPVLHAVADQLPANVQVFQVNVKLDPLLSTHLRVQGVPTFLAFQGGKELNRFNVGPDAAALQGAINKSFGF